MIKVEDLVEIELKKANLVQLEKIIDEKIVKSHGTYPWEDVIIEDTLPMSVRNHIAKKYHEEGGWPYVYHITSEENGEKKGLTEFIFSTKPIPENKAVKMHIISK